MCNIETATKDIRRGDIFYVYKFATEGSEQETGRPAVVVSNPSINRNSKVVEVVYLTTQPKKDMSTHAYIISSGCPSTALCEQISSVSIDKLGDWIGSCSPAEMHDIDMACLASLGINSEVNSNQLSIVMRELEIYKSLYDNLLNKVIPNSNLN